jgi:mevalonate pyrophosphate decarboxylase
LHMVMRDEAAGKTRLVRLLVITQEGSIPVAAGLTRSSSAAAAETG